MDKIDYKHEEGSNDYGDIKLYALSTCGFCKMAINFLKDRSIKFSYIYVDELDMDIKKQLKDELKNRYKTNISFPFLAIDENNCIAGFFKGQWEEQFPE